MTRPVHCDDPRLHAPVCHSLQPVTTVHENAWFAVRDRGGFALTPRYPCFPSIFQVQLTRQEFQNRTPHDDEIEEVRCFSFPAIIKMILDGEIYIGLQVAILTRFLLENRFLVPRNDQ